MASLNLDTDELRAVESSRQRLSQLSNSIASLRADVFTTSPLPTLYVPFWSFRRGSFHLAFFADFSGTEQFSLFLLCGGRQRTSHPIMSSQSSGASATFLMNCYGCC